MAGFKLGRAMLKYRGRGTEREQVYTDRKVRGIMVLKRIVKCLAVKDEKERSFVCSVQNPAKDGCNDAITIETRD